MIEKLLGLGVAYAESAAATAAPEEAARHG